MKKVWTNSDFGLEVYSPLVNQLVDCTSSVISIRTSEKELVSCVLKVFHF